MIEFSRCLGNCELLHCLQSTQLWRWSPKLGFHDPSVFASAA